MTDSRPVTLYEYASLRMHPNRERAKRRHANPVHPKPTHHKTRIAIVDKLGNVLAPNAAGRRYPGATLSKRKRLRPALSASEVDTDSRSVSRKRRRLDADGELGSDFVPSDEDVDADSDEDEWMPKTQQARNRAAFYHDQSFLNEPDSTTSNGRALNDLRKSFHPSADLLKYIHWHASEMWTEDGMLFDDNAEKSKYWMARNGAAGGKGKRRRRGRDKRSDDESSSDKSPSSSLLDGEDSTSASGSHSNSSSGESDDDDLSDPQPKRKGQRKTKTKAGGKKRVRIRLQKSQIDKRYRDRRRAMEKPQLAELQVLFRRTIGRRPRAGREGGHGDDNKDEDGEHGSSDSEDGDELDEDEDDAATSERQRKLLHEKLRRNVFRGFDGSALLCIGKL